MEHSQSTPDVKALAIQVVSKVRPIVGISPPNWLAPDYTPYGWDDDRLLHLERTRDQLEAEGFEYLGSGNFSVTYAHRDYPERVLKIAINPDTAGAAWWQYCMDHLGPHIPKVYAVGKLGNDKYSSRVDFVWMKRYTGGGGDRYDLSRAFSEQSLGVQPCLPENLHEQMRGICEVMEVAEQFGCADLHDGNLMFDPDTNNWVVMDPVF